MRKIVIVVMVGCATSSSTQVEHPVRVEEHPRNVPNTAQREIPTQEVVIACDGDPGEDLARLEERFSYVAGQRITLTPRADGEVVVTLPQSVDPLTLARAIRRGGLAVHLEELNTQGLVDTELDLEGAQLSLERLSSASVTQSVPMWTATTQQELLPIANAAERLLGAHTFYRIASMSPRTWATCFVEAEPVLTQEEVIDVRMVAQDDEAALRLELSPRGRRLFTEATRRGVARRMAVVISGELVSWPFITEPIEAPAPTVLVHVYGETEANFALALGYAGSLQTAPLSAEWRLKES